MYGYRDVSVDYDIYPMVIPADAESAVTVRPLGAHAEFLRDKNYTLEVHPTTTGPERVYGALSGVKRYPLVPENDGSVILKHFFGGEQEHFIRIVESGKTVVQLSVYSVKPDLYGRYAYMGDLHMHTFRSDGKQSPAVVAASYRKFGYDFMPITDHRVYYGALEAIDAYRDVPLDFKLFPGEEIHLPSNDVHIVNFGGKYSINGLLDCSEQCKRKGTSPEFRALDRKTAPEVISEDEYRRQVNEIADGTEDLPQGVDRFTYASCVWIFNRIREAGGLGIFAHPYWVCGVYQVPESLVEYMMEKRPFDAFEVLGGENYFEQNGFQTARYYSDRAKGRIYPVVGSTDSHSCVNNDNAYLARTVVFSPDCSCDGIIGSIKDMYSVAVDGISREMRIVGEERLVRYGWFLLTHYFPIHDDLCREEGRLMKVYATGSQNEKEEAGRTLAFINGRMSRLRTKYFGR